MAPMTGTISKGTHSLTDWEDGQVSRIHWKKNSRKRRRHWRKAKERQGRQSLWRWIPGCCCCCLSGQAINRVKRRWLRLQQTQTQREGPHCRPCPARLEHTAFGVEFSQSWVLLAPSGNCCCCQCLPEKWCEKSFLSFFLSLSFSFRCAR